MRAFSREVRGAGSEESNDEHGSGWARPSARKNGRAMVKQNIIVDLDSETIHYLAALGKPTDVLARLAFSAADGVRRPRRPKREPTNESLRVEREKSDVAVAKERA